MWSHTLRASCYAVERVERSHRLKFQPTKQTRLANLVGYMLVNALLSPHLKSVIVKTTVPPLATWIKDLSNDFHNTERAF